MALETRAAGCSLRDSTMVSGRHLLPDLFIWPSPTTLATRFVRAAAAGDLETAVSLTNGSDTCRANVRRAFADLDASLQQAAGGERSPAIQSVTVAREMTTYEAPIPADKVLPPPIPTQQAVIRVTMPSSRSIWLTMDMQYRPIWGRRFLCQS